MADKTKKEKKSFFKGLKAELKKVIWPTSKQVTNKTIAVIALVLIISAIVIILDLGLEKLTENLVYGKLKDAISPQTTTDIIQSVEETENLENTEDDTTTENDEIVE